MGANSTLFLKMSERDFLQIPEGVRQAHLSDKVYKQSPDDYAELIQDSRYKELYNAKKKAAKELDDYTYHLREQRRKALANTH